MTDETVWSLKQFGLIGISLVLWLLLFGVTWCGWQAVNAAADWIAG